MTFDPTQNRVPTCLLTADELAALKAAKHGWEWLCNTYGDWGGVIPSWSPEQIYRAKPAPAPTLSITVNGVTNVVAAPETEALAFGDTHWVVSPAYRDGCLVAKWGGSEVDLRRLRDGLIHLTEAAARAHAMAMVGLKAEGAL